MKKNIHRIAKPIAYITATTLIAATLFACGSKDDDVSKIKEDVENNSVSEETKSLKEIFGMFFDDEDDTNEDGTDVELETETSIVTEVNDDGEEVTKVVTYVQTEDGTKKIVDNSNSGSNSNNGAAANNNSSTQKPNGGNSSNGGNSNGSLGNNTQSGGNNGSSNTTTTNKPVTSSGSNNNGNAGSSNNASTATTDATEENDNTGINISSGGYTCTGEKYQGGGTIPTSNFGVQNVAHMNVVKEYDMGLVTNAHHSNNYEINPSNNTDIEKVLSYPCLEVQYYMLCTCQDCGAYWWEDTTGTGFVPGDEYSSSELSEKTYFIKTATESHNYIEKEVLPATYTDYGEIDCICTKCGDTYFDRNTAKLKWDNDYDTSDLGLNGLETHYDDGIQRYDSEITKLKNLDFWDTEYAVVDEKYGVDNLYYFYYIYKKDSAGNPIYEKTILGYDKNGNAIYNDRPYWFSCDGEYKIYKTIADIKSNNPVYSWANRTADGTLVE